MPEKYRRGWKTLFLRLPVQYKDRLNAIAKELTALHPGGKFTPTEIARDAVCRRVEELEKKLKNGEIQRKTKI